MNGTCQDGRTIRSAGTTPSEDGRTMQTPNHRFVPTERFAAADRSGLRSVQHKRTDIDQT